MEDKRTILAVILSIAFIVVYSQTFITRPPPPPPHPAVSTAPVMPQPGASPINVAAVPVQAPQAAQTAPSRTYAHYSQSPKLTVETDLIRAELSSLGGRLLDYELKAFPKDLTSTDPVDLISHSEQSPLPLGILAGELSDGDVQYTLGDNFTSDRSVRIREHEEAQVDLVGKLSDGTTIRKTLVFKANSYLTDITVKLENGPSASAPIWLEWVHHVSGADAHARRNPVGFKTFSPQQKLTTVIGDNIPEGLSPLQSVRWLSFEDKYFLATLIPVLPDNNAQTGIQRFVDRSETLFLRGLVGVGSGTLHVFAGPKEDHILGAAGYQLERNIDLGIFSFLAFPLLWLMRFFQGFLGNWGLSIIVLTLFIKAAFLPLTKASFKSMQAMQELQPEIKALRERISDPTQLNQEMLGLYKRRGVNPMGGCFPILIQIPVFIGLYNALLNAFELRHARFALWVQDLSAPEALHLFGIPVPVMVLILGTSMFIQQYMMPNTMDATQRKVMFLMPLILTASFIIYPLPAGLVLYWLVNNTISIVQQSYIKNHRKTGPFGATALAGVAIFAFGYVLTLV